MGLFGLPKNDKRSIAEGLIAWGNLVFAALALGQTGLILQGGLPNAGLTVAGVVFWLIAYAIAFVILKGGD